MPNAALPKLTALGRRPSRWDPRYREVKNRLARMFYKTRRVWKADRELLDLHRPLPAGSEFMPRLLKKVNRGLFLAFNRVLWRWEVWCSRDEWGMVPYYVMRVVIHPNKRDELDHCIDPCPERPQRYRGGHWTSWERKKRIYRPDCPPSCPGVYQVPDTRLLFIMRQADMTVNGERRLYHDLERRDRLKEVSLENYYTSHSENIISENLNRLLGIKQWGYTG